MYLCFFFKSLGQISNLLVNQSSTHFSMVSGSEISWSYDLPTGDTAIVEIWLDVNSNGVIEPATDVLWQSFYQIDGGGGQMTPDQDGLANGHIMFRKKWG